jgi:hypothetical protein
MWHVCPFEIPLIKSDFPILPDKLEDRDHFFQKVLDLFCMIGYGLSPR